MECVVYFVDPTSPGSLGFLGGKERIRIPIKTEYNLFDTFKQHIAEHAGRKAEAEKRGLGSSIQLTVPAGKNCRR